MSSRETRHRTEPRAHLRLVRLGEPLLLAPLAPRERNGDERAALARAAFEESTIMLAHTVRSVVRALSVASRTCGRLGLSALRASWSARLERVDPLRLP